MTCDFFFFLFWTVRQYSLIWAHTVPYSWDNTAVPVTHLPWAQFFLFLAPHTHMLPACVPQTTARLLCGVALFTFECPHLRDPHLQCRKSGCQKQDQLSQDLFSSLIWGQFLKVISVMSRFGDEYTWIFQLYKHFAFKQYYECHKICSSVWYLST